jgi:phosphonatase-like hydrolase
MKVDLVVLDMAGTTVFDGDAVHTCLQQALAAGGEHVTRSAVNAVMGQPKPLAIEILLTEARNGAVPPPEEVEALHADFMGRMLQYYRMDPAVREIPGAADVFRELRTRGVKVFLDTGFNRTIADAVLARLSWDRPGVLDGTVTSDEVAKGRPHPDMVLRAMEMGGVGDPRRVAKVGDTPADLLEGHAAGCRLVVGVTEGSHTEGELRAHPHTHLIPNVGHLPALVLGD